MREILVTGGAGFIGSRFVRHMFDNYSDVRIVVLDLLTYAGNPENLDEDIKQSDRFEFWYGNVNNAGLVGQLIGRVDQVVHFAAESHVARSIFDDRVFFETDVMGTQTMCSLAAKSPNIDRFVHVSTSEVYGTALVDPMDEDHALNPLTPYASAKCGADRLVYSYQRTHDLPAVILRPFNQYGPWQHLEKVIPRFITSALEGEPLTVHGDGSSRRDWGYVFDTCKAIDKVLSADRETVVGEVINLGSGVSVDVLTIAKTIVEAVGADPGLVQHVYDRPGQVQDHISSVDKAARLLDWRSETPFAEGLARTVKWYAENKPWWQGQRWMRHVPIKTKDGDVQLY